MAHLAMSALHHAQFLINCFHICHKWSQAYEGVLHTMIYDLDLYLQGYLAVTLPILWIIFMCGTDTTHEGTMCLVMFPGL